VHSFDSRNSRPFAV